MLPSFLSFVIIDVKSCQQFFVWSKLFSFYDNRTTWLTIHVFVYTDIQYLHNSRFSIVQQINFFCNSQENIFWGSYHIISLISHNSRIGSFRGRIRHAFGKDWKWTQKWKGSSSSVEKYACSCSILYVWRSHTLCYSSGKIFYVN